MQLFRETSKIERTKSPSSDDKLRFSLSLPTFFEFCVEVHKKYKYYNLMKTMSVSKNILSIYLLLTSLIHSKQQQSVLALENIPQGAVSDFASFCSSHFILLSVLLILPFLVIGGEILQSMNTRLQWNKNVASKLAIEIIKTKLIIVVWSA